jgi:Transposase IS66 family
MVKIGEEVTEYVEYTPGRLRKIRIIRPKYGNKNTEGPLLIAPAQSKEQGEQNIKPLLVNLKAWVEEQSDYVTPQSPIGKAMAYMQTQWPKIMEVFNNGRYELDSNLIENKIRPLALGRRNYLFAGSHDGAQRIAMMYSFFGSCAANGINPVK